jgi:hypothetical protein
MGYLRAPPYPGYVKGSKGFSRPADAAVAGTPAIVSFTPTSGSNPTTVVITLEEMPSGWTLNTIKIGGVDLVNMNKNSDTEIQGDINVSHSTGVIQVTYNTDQTIDTSGLSPAVFTVV